MPQVYALKEGDSGETNPLVQSKLLLDTNKYTKFVKKTNHLFDYRNELSAKSIIRSSGKYVEGCARCLFDTQVRIQIILYKIRRNKPVKGHMHMMTSWPLVVDFVEMTMQLGPRLITVAHLPFAFVFRRTPRIITSRSFRREPTSRYSLMVYIAFGRFSFRLCAVEEDRTLSLHLLLLFSWEK